MKLIRRFWPDAPSIGTEAGRTSRGTLPAVERLAESLNALREALGPLTEKERERLADAMQRWIIDHPIAEHFKRQRLEAPLDPRLASVSNFKAILETAKHRKLSGPVAQHLVGAKLALRYPEQEIENYSYTTADVQLNRPGDFVVGDTVFHVTMAPARDVIEKCGRNIGDGFRCVLLVPADQQEFAARLADQEVGGSVAVLSIEAFVGQNVEEIAGFRQSQFEITLRRLLETYNERVQEAETDPALLIDIPDNLGAT